MDRLSRSRVATEDGFALAAVMFLGAVIVLLSAIIVARGSSQSNLEVNDGQWEQALFAAEGGMDDHFVDLAAAPDPDAIDTGHTISQLSTKAMIIAEARAYAIANPSEVLSTPEGEVVVLKPSDDRSIYAVGFVPDVADTGAEVRVISAEYDFTSGSTSWSAPLALLTGNDIIISGNVHFNGAAGGMHTNGELDLDGKIWADACVTASDGFDGSASDIKDVGAGCPTSGSEIGSQPEIEIPTMSPRDLWADAEYQMCSDGKVRAGPAHPTAGSTAGTTPCEATAFLLGDADGTEWRDWKMTGWDDKLGAKWDYTSNQPKDGSYYFYIGSVYIGTNPSNWDITVVTEASGAACNKVGGDISISGNIGSVPYDTIGITMFADRDLDISGNKNTEGIMVAMEQLKISGNPDIDGSLIIVDECDTPDSNIHQSEISGNPQITYSGSSTTPWTTGGGPATLSIVDRSEV